MSENSLIKVIFTMWDGMVDVIYFIDPDHVRRFLSEILWFDDIKSMSYEVLYDERVFAYVD